MYNMQAEVDPIKFRLCDNSNDLPLFGQIDDILVINDNALLFRVLVCETAGIDRHYHSFSISVTDREDVICFPELVDYHTFYGYKLNNGNLSSISH